MLVVEAGGSDNWIWFHIPVGYLYAIGNPRADWMFKTAPEPGLGGRSIAYPRGRVVGGSSAINAMIYMRGQAADYDGWRQLGLAGWGWDDVLPYFLRQEDHHGGASVLHGVGGEWRVERPRVSWPILDAVREAGVEIGIPKIDDFNRGDNEGSAYFEVNQRRGRRWSAATAFLKPILKRPNLRLATRAHVERILFEGRRAIGLRYSQDAVDLLLDDEQGGPLLVDQAELLVDGVDDGGRQPERQLVGDQQLRRDDEHLGQREQPLLAAGQRAAALAAALAEHGESVVGPGERAGDGPPAGALAEGDDEVLLDSQVGEDAATLGHVGDTGPGDAVGRPAGDVGAADDDPAGGGGEQAGDDPGDGRLAGTVRPEQRDRAAVGHGERDTEERPVRTVGGVDVVDLEGGHADAPR